MKSKYTLLLWQKQKQIASRFLVSLNLIYFLFMTLYQLKELCSIDINTHSLYSTWGVKHSSWMSSRSSRQGRWDLSEWTNQEALTMLVSVSRMTSMLTSRITTLKQSFSTYFWSVSPSFFCSVDTTHWVNYRWESETLIFI